MLKPGSLAAGPDRFPRWVMGLSSRFPAISQLDWKYPLAWAAPLLFFAVLGVGLYHQALTPNFPPHHLARLPLEQEVILSGRLYRPSRMRPERVRLYLAVEAWKSSQDWWPATGNLLLTAPLLTSPPVGTEVVVRGKLRKPRALLNPGAWNQPQHLAAEDIFRQMHLHDPTHLVFLASPEAPSLAERLRVGVRRLLQDMPPTTRAMYLAMLLGDQGEVTPKMRQQFSRTGTSHLLAISGLHLGALAAVTYFLVFWLLRCFPWVLLRVNVMKISTLAATLPVVSYAHLAGGSPATQRAEVMVLAYLLLVLLGRPREVWSALALAALVILILSPLRLFSVSFKLSFAAVSGIIYFLPRWFGTKAEASTSGDLLRGWSSRLRRGLTEALALSAVASLVTAPLVAHYFQVVSLYGFLVNLVAIPLVLMLSLPVGGLAVLAEVFSLTPLAQVILVAGSLPLKLGYLIIAWTAQLPWSGITVPSPTWLQVALMYGMIFLVFKLIYSLRLCAKHRHEKSPQTLSWWKKNYWSCVGTGLFGLALIFSLALTEWGTPQSGEITVLDSYAGLDGVLVTPGGERVAVTAAWDIWPGWEGGGMGPLPGYLHWRQFRRLDTVLALNLNARNAQEMLTLAEQFEVGGFWWRGRRPVGKVVDLMNLLGDAGRPALSLTRMRPPLNPPTSLGGMSLAYPSWDNGGGVALKVTYQGRQALILPPLPLAVVKKLPWPEESPLAVLVAPEDVPPSVVARLKPGNLVFYGSRGPEGGNVDPSRPPAYLTRQGAVTLTFTEKGAFFRQWRP
jgi:competence protein ComEC